MTSPKLVQSSNVPGPRGSKRDLTVRWYDDGSIRVSFKGAERIVIEESYLQQKDPMIRVAPYDWEVEGDGST